MKHFCSRFFTTKLASNFFASITLFFVILSSTNIYLVGQTVDPKIDTQQIEEILEANSVSEKDGTVGEQALGDVQNKSNENQEVQNQVDISTVNKLKKLEFNENKTIEKDDIKAVVQAGTEVKAEGDEDLKSKELVIEKLATEQPKDNQNSLKTFEFGNPDQHLIFSKPVRIEVEVSTNQPFVEIGVKHEGENEFGTKGLVNENGTPETKFEVKNGKVVFYTLEASAYNVTVTSGTVTVTNPTNGGSMSQLAAFTGTGSIDGTIVTVALVPSGITVGQSIVSGGTWTITPTQQIPVGANSISVNGGPAINFTATAAGGQTTANILNFSPVCVGNALTFPGAVTANGTGNLVTQSPTHNYGTLAQAPNYKLFYMKIVQGGVLNITQSNSANSDVDGALWGPFNDIPDFLRTGAAGAPIAQRYPAPLASDYTSGANFNFNVNVTSNKFYVLIIANFAGTPTNISFSTGGGTTATSDCNLLSYGIDATYTAPSVQTKENGFTGTYTISLTKPPSSNVTVNIPQTNGQVTTSTTSLTFTPTNWYIPQTVTVTAIDDIVSDGSQSVNIVNNVTSSDPNYNNLVKNIPAIAYDNDISPGGVSSGLLLWNRADIGAATSGSNVSSWADQKGTNIFTITGTPTKVDAAYNFNPTVQFPGGSRFIGNTSLNNITELFAVGKIVNGTAGTTTGALIGSTSATVGEKYAFHTEGGILYASGNNGATFTGTNAFGNNVPFSIMNVDHSETPGANQRIKVNGLNYANNPGGDPAIYSATPTLGSRGPENILNGSQLSEAIIYDTSLAGTNRQKVNSYLATKYGITLDQSTPTSYLATDGTAYWNGTTNSTYNKNITVLGRDDATALNQKQSKSINTPGLVTVGRGGIVASNEANTNTFTNDKSYFAFGDDNGALTWSNTGAPSGRQILGRKFKAQNLNYSQSTIVSVPDDSSTATTKLSSELNTVYLLVDTDGDGNFTTGSPTEVAMTLNGTNWETSATIPTGAVFTFATNTPLTVTVEQASGQTDPQAIGAANTVVNYTATFNQDINTSSFVNGDVTISGTATGCSVTGITPNPSGQSKIFTIALDCGNSAANHNKTVLVSLAASTVESLSSSSITNSASTSADNTVTLIDNTPPVAPSSAPDMTSGTDLGSSNSDNNTSDNTPDFTGSCSNGETVTLFVDGIANGSQVCSGGTYTITPTTPISNGLHNITTKFTDPAGNQSAASPILPIIIDTTAPSAPSAPDMTGATDTGSSNSDNITSDTTPDFTGTCTNGETITIRVDGTPISPTQVCSGGTYTITPLSPIATGSRSITTTATDIAGNTSSPSSALNITIDNSVPTTPASSPDMTGGTDTGVSNTDNLTNNSQPTFTGTCTTGNTVTLFVDGTSITPTQVCVGGVYNITPSSPISSGNHSITNTETNPAGNTSSSSPALSITIDTTPPATPTTAPDMTAATDTGTSNTDNTTNDNTPDFTGTCTPGDTITIFVDGVANGSQVCNSGGTYTITASPAISDGPHNVTIKTTDPAGNQSAASPALPITIDTSAPSAPTSSPDMTPGTDTGSSNTDNNTSDNTPTFTGSCTSGDTVTLFVDGTAVAPSTVCTGGNYSITPSSPISDGSHNITTKFTDPAGNQSAASPNLPIVIDSTAPTTLGTPDMNPATDSGISNTDNITNEDQPTFDGTCTNGDVITLYVDGSAIVPTAVCSGGNYSITPSSPISNGTHNITVTATDTAGNTSAPSTPLNITIDTSVPSAPTAPDMTAATDSGSSSTDNITSDSTPDFTGTCTNGETIRVYVDGIAITPTAVCSGGTYTITPSTPLTNGGHSITTTTTDLGGNESPQSPALTITIDTTGLTVVVNKAPAQAQATNVQPVKFEITFSEAINSSSLTTSDIVLSTFDNLGTITAINQISPTVFEVVVQGLTIRPVSQNNPVSISLAANAVTDLAGNTSTASTNGSQPIVDYAVPPPYVIPQITNNPSPTLTGACSPNANLDITVNSIVYPTTCTAGGTWSQVVTAPNGTYNVLITDNTNNVDNSTTQPSLDELVIDTVAPTVEINQKSGQPDPTNQASILFTVNIGENGSQINPSTFTTADFTLGGTATGTITNMTQVSPGVYEVTVTPTTSGTVILSMNAGVFTDNAGNLNTASTSTDNTVTFDNILPVAPTVNPLITNDTTPTITGTCENGTTISVQVGSQTMNTTCTGGTYSVTVGTPLADNTYNVVVTSTDSAGNQSIDATSNELVIDTISPNAPTAPDMTPGTDTGSSNSDNTTADTTPDFTGSCTPGETVTVFVDGIANGSQLCPGSGIYSITPTTPIADGLHNITTTSTDLAGNQSAASPILPIIIDTSAPVAPVVSSPAPNANVNDNTPTFTGTGEPGATITIMDGTTPICTAVVDPSGNWTCTPSSPLTDGPHAINITQTDPAGNVSPTTSLPINIDTVAPVAPTSAPDMTPGTDTGSSNTDNNTSDTTPTLTGTCTNGETVKLYVDGFAVAPSVVCSGGTYSITPTNPIPDGNHNLTTTFTDLSGNESAPSPALSVVIDSTPPTTPSSPTNTSPATDNTPTFTGSCTPGDTVTIVIDGNAIAPTQICPVGGTYSITPTTPLTDGSHSVQAQFTDPAGNVSPLSPAITISIDTSVPVAPVVSSPAPGSNLNDNTPTFTGTGEPGATITIMDGTTPICTAVVQPNGSWACTPVIPLTEGPHTFNITQTDPAGNVSPTTTLSINIDTVVPVAPAIGGPISGSIVTTDKPTFTGTSEPGTTVTVKDANGNTVCTVIADSSGNWTCTPTVSQGEGTKTFTAIATDPAGNESPNSAPATVITIDVNTDGVTKLEEDGAPNNGDGNGDGTLDSEQDTVTSKPNPNISGGYNTLEVTGLAGSCARIGDFDFKAESVLGSQDVPRDYPIGLFKFRIFCMTPGGSAQVKIILDKEYNTSGWVYKKFNTQTNQYAEMQGVTYGTQTIGGNQVTTINFVAVDGGPFDEDGLANGEYIDPSGPSINAPATQPQSPTPLARTGYNFGLSLILGGITALIVSSINMKKRKE